MNKSQSNVALFNLFVLCVYSVLTSSAQSGLPFVVDPLLNSRGAPAAAPRQVGRRHGGSNGAIFHGRQTPERRLEPVYQSAASQGHSEGRHLSLT